MNSIKFKMDILRIIFIMKKNEMTQLQTNIIQFIFVDFLVYLQIR